MSSQLYADSKLQYYPTSPIITSQILSVLSSYISNKEGCYDKYSQLENDLRDEYYKLPNQQSIRFSNYISAYMCNNSKYHKLIQASVSDSVIADLFAGEGEWLKTFKTMCNTSKCNNTLIGNELEENRYNAMINDNLIDYHYNLPFEELQLPKHSIDIMLFNPPYGTTNGERNTRRYLRMIFEKELMNYTGSMIVFVVKFDDLINCMDLITQYCKDILGYKSHKEEFDKFGQYILFAKVRNNSLDLNKGSEVALYQEELKNNKEYLNLIKDKEFDYEYCSKMSYMSSNTNIKTQMENFIYLQTNEIKTSKMDKAWKWLIQDTQINDLSEEQIIIPKQLKSGELANVIASGKINGELSLEGGKATHITVGGVKQLTSQSTIKVTNRNGESESKLQTTIQNLPYLNLLVNNNGEFQIKELINNPNIESEED